MLSKTVNYQQLYDGYGEYNILFDQLNFTSPSVENALLKTNTLLYAELKKVITEKLKKNTHIVVCEVGFGNGAMLIRLAKDFKGKPISFIGYEISKSFVRYAQKAALFKEVKVDFLYKDIEKEEIPNTFDVVFCSEVLEHLEKPNKFIQKVSNRLNPEGYFLATTPNINNWIKYPFFWLKLLLGKQNERTLSKQLTKKEIQFKLAESEQHIHEFNHNELKKLLRENNLFVYKTPRSTTLFGGGFIDAHYSLFALLLIADIILDVVAVPQIGWDIIIFSKKP